MLKSGTLTQRKQPVKILIAEDERKTGNDLRQTSQSGRRIFLNMSFPLWACSWTPAQRRPGSPTKGAVKLCSIALTRAALGGDDRGKEGLVDNSRSEAIFANWCTANAAQVTPQSPTCRSVNREVSHQLQGVLR